MAKRMTAADLRPGMIVAEPVYSLDHKQILVSVGGELTESAIRLIDKWDIPYIMIVEEEEAKPIPIPPENEREKIEAELAVLPAPLAAKKLAFINTLEAAVADVDTLLEDVRANGTINLAAFREIAARVTRHLILPAEAINKILFRSPAPNARNYLAHHSVAVAAIAGMVTAWMEMTSGFLEDIVLAGLLHDVGKTQLPRSLVADRQLAAEHQEKVKQHIILAFDILKGAAGLSPNVLAAVVQHHECRDGSGYPAALSGSAIHPYARIISVANRLSGMASSSAQLNPFALAETIKGEMFAKLDPAVCDTFIRRFNDYLMNNPVRLSDGRKAKVVFIPGINPTSPVLKTEGDEFIDLTKNKDVKIEGLTF